MDIVWKVPGEPPNPNAIAWMRRHFPKPKEPMPEAWFMGREINFYTPDPYGDAKFLCYVLEQIRGIVWFPEVRYVPVWKAWFRYLLPDLILRANEPENFNAYDRDILAITITTFFNIYPGEIEEEYIGFRNDIVSTLGTRAIPTQLAREKYEEQEDRLFVDIWDESGIIINYDFPLLDEVKSSLLFCLKYLTPDEIKTWAPSLFYIDNPQWYLQMIFLLAEWRKTLKRVQDKTNDIIAPLQTALPESGLLGTNWNPGVLIFDELISSAHVTIFDQVINKHFSIEVYLGWQDSIFKHLNATPYNIENDFYLTRSLEATMRICEWSLFP